MKSFTNILPLLAALLLAILAFDLGTRYGVAQMTALGLARELSLSTKLLVVGGSQMDSTAQQILAERLDYNIATAAEQRRRWYLKKDARAALEAVLVQGLELRGDAVEDRFRFSEERLNALTEAGTVTDPERYKKRMGELLDAVTQARAELLKASSEG